MTPILKGYAIKVSGSKLTLQKKQAQTKVQSLEHAIDIIERQIAHNARCLELIKQLDKKGH